MKPPVGVPVAARAEGAELQDGFGSLERPPGTGSIHSISDEVSARPFNDASCDGEASRERVAVMKQIAVLLQISGARIDRFALRELLERRAAPHSSRDIAGGSPAQ
jgi:hypothetical protein